MRLKTLSAFLSISLGYIASSACSQNPKDDIERLNSKLDYAITRSNHIEAVRLFEELIECGADPETLPVNEGAQLVLSNISEFYDRHYLIQEKEIGINYSVPVPHSPLSLLAGNPTNNSIYHCLNNTYHIEIYDSTAKLIQVIDRPYEKVPYTSKDKEDFIAPYENHRIEGMKKLARGVNFPNVKSVASRLFIDDQGNLWVKTNEQRKDGNKVFTAFDIFNKEGIYEAKVWSGLDPAIILKGKMYRLHVDEETGYRCLKRYRMVWSYS